MTEPRLPTPAFVALVGLTFVATIGAYFAGTLIQFLNLPFGLFVTSLLVFAAAGLFFPAAINLEPLRYTGLSRATLATIGVAALLGLVNLPLVNFLMGIFSELMPDIWVERAKDVSRLFLQAEPTTRVVLVLAAAVAAPLGEELFFRGWLQTTLSLRMRQALSIAVVSVLFSAIHGDPVGFVARVELGVLFGVARAWTGSLWPAITLHAVHNFTSTMVLFLVPDPQAEIDKPVDLLEAAPLAAGSLVLVWLVLVLLRRVSPEKPVEELAPLERDRPTFVPAPRPALVIAATTTCLVLGSAVTLYALRDTLPGHELDLGGLRPPEPLPVD